MKAEDPAPPDVPIKDADPQPGEGEDLVVRIKPRTRTAQLLEVVPNTFPVEFKVLHPDIRSFLYKQKGGKNRCGHITDCHGIPISLTLADKNRVPRGLRKIMAYSRGHWSLG